MTTSRFQELLEDLQSSGLSQKHFCAARGIKCATFQYWKRKLKNDNNIEPSGFLQIAPDTSLGIEVRLPGGISLTLCRGFDSELFRDIIKALTA